MVTAQTNEKGAGNAKTPSQFISEAAHMIKGPLTTIQLYSESLVEGNVGPLTPEQLDYAKEINEASRRLIGTIKELETEARKNK